VTFSIVARDPQNGWLGMATASRALAAGAAGRHIELGVGAIASQAFANPYLAIDGRDLRQLGIVDHEGRVAAYTGERCIPWAGHLIGGGYVCLGNILEGEDVVKAMATAFERSGGDPLYERLMLALEGGEQAGGDRRGRQAAGIEVLAEEEYALCDLRVDDHPDPVAELRRVLEVFKENAVQSHGTRPQREDFTPNWEALVRRRDAIERDLDEKQAVQTARET